MLMLFPPIRPFLFPGLPATQTSDSAASDASPNDQQESHDSLTGAPEAHKGETAEQEAKVLLDSFATMAVEGAAGKYGYHQDEEPTEDSPPAIEAPPPIGSPPETPEDKAAEEKTKKPMKKKVSHGMDQAMRIVSDITDVYERFAK